VLSAALALTACGGEAPASDLSSVKIMAPFLEAQPPSADGAVQKKLEELTGKDVNINWTPNASYEDKMNITLASPDIPHVLVVRARRRASSRTLKPVPSGT
jgi:putative aldouronate transport system substrate-binding protein